MSIKEIKQNRFDGGLTENIRDTSSNKVWYTENVLLENGMVNQTINVSAVNSQSYTTSYNVLKLIDAGNTIYGIGQDNATNKDVSIYSKTAGSSNNWALVTNGTITNSSLRLYDPFFVRYGGDLYFDGGNNYIAKYSGTTLTNNWLSLNSGLSGGIIWQGNMYGYQGQKIYKITTAPAATDMITIPSDQTIKQMIPYGNYIAIICSGTSGYLSKMYIWDGVTTTTFTEIVEIGRGNVSGGNLLDGSIYVVMSLPNSKGFNIMAYSGGRFVSVYKYTGRFNRTRTSQYTFSASTVKYSAGYIYFMVGGTRSDSTFADIYEPMIFRYGRDNVNSNYHLSCWKTLFGDGASSATIGSVGNDFLVYETSLTTQPQSLMAVIYGLDGTDTSYYYESTTTYNSTENTTSSSSGIIETINHNCDEPNAYKQLKAVALYYDPLPSAGSVVLKYRKDEETTWTTIFTDGTDNAVSHATTVIESFGVNLPSFKEIQFRIELSGNAKLTGYKFKYEPLTEENY